MFPALVTYSELCCARWCKEALVFLKCNNRASLMTNCVSGFSNTTLYTIVYSLLQNYILSWLVKTNCLLYHDLQYARRDWSNARHVTCINNHCCPAVSMQHRALSRGSWIRDPLSPGSWWQERHLRLTFGPNATKNDAFQSIFARSSSAAKPSEKKFNYHQ